MIYLRYTFLLIGSSWSLLTTAQDFPSLSKMSEDQAAQKTRVLLDSASTYPNDEVEAVYDSLEFLSRYFRLDSFRIKTYLKRGNYELFGTNNVEKALQYYNNAKELAIETGDEHQELNALALIAQLHNNTAITAKSVEAILELKQRAEEIGDSLNISAAYYLLGQSDIAITDYSVAMFRKSLDYARSGSTRVRIYANLGQAYMQKASPNLDSAQYFLEQAKSLNDSLKVSASIDNTLAEVYLRQGKYEQAEALLLSFLDEGITYGNYDYKLLTYQLLLEILQQRQDHSQAMPYIKDAIASMRTTYYDDYEVLDFSRVAKISLAALGEFDIYQAIDSIEQAAVDSIYAYMESANVSQSKFAYQTNQMEASLNDKEDLLQNRDTIIAILAGALLLSGLLIYQTYHRRRLIAQQRTADQQIFRLEDTAAETLQQQERQLSAYVVSLMYKNSIISRVLDKLKTLNGQVADSEVDQLVKLMESDLKNEDQWKNFLAHFEKVHPNFYRKLDEHYPNLTKQDKRIIAYLKMELTTKEIAQLLGVNYESVNTSRYRIRKKMDLSKETELDSFIARL